MTAGVPLTPWHKMHSPNLQADSRVLQIEHTQDLLHIFLQVTTKKMHKAPPSSNSLLHVAYSLCTI
ncbi:hypothetical protein HanIR_Chr01g0008561 [Helianthus annuus]|nr:hypothetical protein HanIR_Chr01g0008561 [Helianthus annuus]